jgi:hypothetical protein
MRIYLLVVLLFVGLTVGSGVFAQSDSTQDDNECYVGGELEGQCVTEWHWLCGWYIRNSRVNDAPIPEWCHYNSETVQLPLSPYPSAHCFYNGINYDDYTDFGGGWWLPAQAPIYIDANCTILNGEKWNYNIIYAPAPYDPEILCQIAFGTSLLGFSTGAPDLYLCQ